MSLDHQWLALLLEEEADLGRGERRTKQPRVVEYRIEVEVFDHLQRALNFFPSAAPLRRIQQVDERTHQGRDACDAACVAVLSDLAAQVSLGPKRRGRQDRNELETR